MKGRPKALVISSGKGGVGKSFIAANLAATCSALGIKTGLIDADIYGYCIPSLFGTSQPPMQSGGKLIPAKSWGVETVSIGMFARGGPVLWRGPRLGRVFSQFLTQTLWGDLDLLIIDMPPGTGDMAISCAQSLKGAECLVVTTPQPFASSIACRAGLAFLKLGVKLAGVVENMSFMEGLDALPFGQGGGRESAAKLSAEAGEPVPLLAQIPLFQQARFQDRPAVLDGNGKLGSSTLSRIFESIFSKLNSSMDIKREAR